MAEMAILASTQIRQTGEFSASTRIRQIRRRVAIAYQNLKVKTLPSGQTQTGIPTEVTWQLTDKDWSSGEKQ